MRIYAWILILFLSHQAFAFGLQHGIFRSQSTQGPSWTGSAPIVGENYRITVNRNYLDVELTLEFGVDGNKPNAYSDALEIVGNLNLEANSTVVGMLVWYHERILKAKLKTRNAARSQYEDVVDRDSPVPPRPRDPVLLEWMGQDNYDISIFPVEWGGTRKLRMRYLIPANGMQMGYPHAFSNRAKVAIELGAGVDFCELVASNGALDTLRASRELSGDQYEFTAFNSGLSKIRPLALRPHLKGTPTTSNMILGAFRSNRWNGYMAHVNYRIPTEFLRESTELSTDSVQLFATLYSSSDSCRKAIRGSALVNQSTESLRLFSSDPLDVKMSWSLYRGNNLIRKATENMHVTQVQDGLQYARSFGMVAFDVLSSTMPASLGIALGFLDPKYSLVALEEDSLRRDIEPFYAKLGVPTLYPRDLFPDSLEKKDLPVEQWIKQRFTSQDDLLAKRQAALPGDLVVAVASPSTHPSLSQSHGWHYFVRNGALYVLFDLKALSDQEQVQIAVIDLKGKVLQSWNRSQLSYREIVWTPSESLGRGGVFILRVKLAGKMFSQTFLIP